MYTIHYNNSSIYYNGDSEKVNNLPISKDVCIATFDSEEEMNTMMNLMTIGNEKLINLLKKSIHEIEKFYGEETELSEELKDFLDELI